MPMERFSDKRCRIHFTFEVSLFRVDEFVKFDEKLQVHTNWMGGKYNTYL